MCEVWGRTHSFRAICSIKNPRTGNKVKVPLWHPIYYLDEIGIRKPSGIPLDRSLNLSGPLTFVGFGITKENSEWDDYKNSTVEGQVVIILTSVPRDDLKSFPDPYSTLEYKISNAIEHRAKAIIMTESKTTSLSNSIPYTLKKPVIRRDDVVVVFIPKGILDILLGELQRGFTISSLQAKIEEKMIPLGPLPLGLEIEILYEGNEFEKYESAHFIVYFHKRTLAERKLHEIIQEREKVYTRIAEILGIEPPHKIRLFLFPSSREKTFYTGHIGAGAAQGFTVMEVYNEEIKVEPHHELTHIIASLINPSPPALLNEGLAVSIVPYWDGKHVDEWVRLYRRKKELIPLMTLLTFTEIGSPSTMPSVSYPEAGSFVKFLIERYGIDKFRQLYSKAKNGREFLKFNKELFIKVYGKSVEQLEEEWLGSLMY